MHIVGHSSEESSERSMRYDFVRVYIRQKSDPHRPIAPLKCSCARKLARFEGKLLSKFVARLAS